MAMKSFTVTKNFSSYNNTYRGCFYTSRKFLGIGLMLDWNPPFTYNEAVFMFEIRLLWLCFWVGKSKSKKPKTQRNRKLTIIVILTALILILVAMCECKAKNCHCVKKTAFKGKRVLTDMDRLKGRKI